MTKESILVGVANKSAVQMDVETLKTWVPKEINYFRDEVYFKHEDTFYSMKIKDFNNVFNQK